MILLELKEDKTKFCFFFLKGRGRLHCFRYTTIIFGFISSPFILSFILLCHAAQFPPDPCRHMMANLVMTGDRPDEL